jgi:predicted kinase
MILVVMGRIGTGKSTIARRLGEALGWLVLSSDRARKRLAGLALHERPSRKARQSLYSREMSEQVYTHLHRCALEHAAQGHSLILDATFGRRAGRDQLRQFLDRREVCHAFVELTARDDAIQNRLADRATRSDVISDARAEDFDTLSAAYEPPNDPVSDFVVPIDTERPEDETLREICMRLTGLRVESR